MAEITEYESVSHRLKVLSWSEATVEELVEFVGEDNVHPIPGGVQVRNAEGRWETLGSGWLVTLTDAGQRIVMSSGALDGLQYRRV
jgi:hypothetical protein